jgi:uncharacterized protein (TIGR02246 family)
MKALTLLLALLGTPMLCLAEVPEHTEVCVAADKDDIAALFNRWNAAVKTGDPHQVVANYAEKSVLLATVSAKPRLTPNEKAAYFQEFMRNQPEGRIDSRTIELDCNLAIDEGQYTFLFKTNGATIKARYSFIYRWNGKQWLIISHHSSKVPSEHAPLEDLPHTIAQHSEVCVAADEQSIIALFDRWKESIESRNAHKVMANYAARSVLLPLSSTTPRLTLDDNEDYYRHFLKDRPLVHVHSRTIEIDCNTAIDEGLYAFNFQRTGTIVNARYSIVYKWDGMQWLITSDHSSILP